jgi:hypothetical protein
MTMNDRYAYAKITKNMSCHSSIWSKFTNDKVIIKNLYALRERDKYIKHLPKEYVSFSKAMVNVHADQMTPNITLPTKYNWNLKKNKVDHFVWNFIKMNIIGTYKIKKEKNINPCFCG